MKILSKFYVSIVTVVLGSVFSGCGVTSTREPTVENQPAIEKNDPRPLAGQMLFKILSAQIAVREGNTLEAAQLYEKIAQTYPDTENIFFYALNYASLAGRKDLVEKNLIRILNGIEAGNLKPSVTQIKQLFKVSMSLNTQSISEKLYNELVDADVSSNELLLFLEASDEEFSSQNSNGVLLFLQAAVHDELDVLLYEAWIKALVWRELFGEAQAAITKGLQAYPNYKELKYLNAQLSFSMGLYSEAKEKIEAMENITEPNYQLLLARIYGRNNQPNKARGIFEELEKDDEYRDWANYFLGLMYIRNGALDEAEKVLKKIDSDQLRFQKNYELASIYRSQKRYQEALNILSGTKSQTEEQLEQNLILASQVFYDVGDSKSGLNLLNEFLKKYPNRVEALYQRGSFLIALDDVKGFERDMRTIINIDENHSEALNGLGYILADELDRAEEAVPLIERALKLKPSAYHILDSLGWAKYRLKEYKEAILYLRQAMNLKYDPEVIGHIVEVLFVSGQTEEAHTLWEEAHKKFPSADILEKVGKLINSSKE